MLTKGPAEYKRTPGQHEWRSRRTWNQKVLSSDNKNNNKTLNREFKSASDFIFNSYCNKATKHSCRGCTLQINGEQSSKTITGYFLKASFTLSKKIFRIINLYIFGVAIEIFFFIFHFLFLRHFYAGLKRKISHSFSRKYEVSINLVYLDKILLKCPNISFFVREIFRENHVTLYVFAKIIKTFATQKLLQDDARMCSFLTHILAIWWRINIFTVMCLNLMSPNIFTTRPLFLMLMTSYTFL